MNSKLLAWFTTRASPKNIILSFMVVIPFNAIFFPLLTGQIEKYSGGVKTLDVTLGYLPQTALQAVKSYQPQGRTLYLITQWTADLFFPLAYTMLFSLLLASLYRRAFSPDSPFQNLRWAPIAMMLFDYLENISVSLLLITHPNSPMPLAITASIVSLLKWVLGATAGIALLVGLIALFVKLVNAQSSRGG